MEKPTEPKNTCPIIDESIRDFREELETSIEVIKREYEKQAENLRKCNESLRIYAHELEEYYEDIISELNDSIQDLSEKMDTIHSVCQRYEKNEIER